MDIPRDEPSPPQRDNTSRVTLVAVGVLPVALDEFAGDEDPPPLLRVCAAFSGDRSLCRAAEETAVDVLPPAVVLHSDATGRSPRRDDGAQPTTKSSEQLVSAHRAVALRS